MDALSIGAGIAVAGLWLLFMIAKAAERSLEELRAIKHLLQSALYQNPTEDRYSQVQDIAMNVRGLMRLAAEKQPRVGPSGD